MKSNPVKFNTAVIGLGVGQKHVETLVKMPQVEKIHICDLDPKKTEETVAYDEEKIQIRTYQDILNDSGISLVSIATFDHDHGKTVLECLESGKHVFVEKPLCTSIEELSKIKKSLAEKNNLHLMSNLVLREAELYKWLREKIKKGEFGEIYNFEGDYLYGRLHKILKGWRGQSPNYSVMLGGGIHIIDLMVYLTDQNPHHVTSFANKVVTQGTSFAYNDNMTSIFQFESGMMAKINANFGCVHPHQHFLRIYGTKGTFILDDQGPRVFWNRGDSEIAERLKLDPLPVSKGVLLPVFIDEINKSAGEANFQREIDLISIIYAADRSVKTDQREKIEYI